MKNGVENHFHIAAQAHDPGLEQALLALGFEDDRLEHAGVAFGPQTDAKLQSCALNVIHQSLHGATVERILEVRSLLEPVLNDPARVPGYYHIEQVRDREIAKGIPRRIVPKAFPVAPLVAERRPTPKIWDLHLSVGLQDIEKIDPIFLENEFYSIDRTDGIDRWRVYTVQGINSLLEGEHLFDSLTNWLRQSGVRNYWAGFEQTTSMRTFGDTKGLPEIVPPTVDSVTFR